MRHTGDEHHRTRIPDAIVYELRDLREHKALRYKELVELFALRGVHLTYSVVKKICRYERRTGVLAHEQ